MTPHPAYTSSSALPKGLPLELWKLILSYIEPDYEQTIPIDKAIARRQFLSVESFVPPDPRDSLANSGRLCIGKLRLVCRSFADIGAPFQFTQIVVRFSRQGLRRLDNIARCPHLAHLVRRFTCTYTVDQSPHYLRHVLTLLFGVRHGAILLPGG